MTYDMMRQPKNGGFSLIELSIGLVILGLILGATMQVYTLYRIKKAKDDTVGHQVIVTSALANYYVTNRYYPCPADRTLPPNAPDRGKGVRDPATNKCLIPAALAPNTCSPDDGICNATGYNADGVGGGDPVYIGAIPFQDLKIPFNETLDGWGRQQGYSVTASLALNKAAFNNDHGAIEIYSPDAAKYNSGVMLPVLDTDPDDPGKPLLYHYMVISYGADGYGAYMPNGVLYHPCSTEVPLPADAMNCENKAQFMMMSYGQGFGDKRGAMHYDDYLSGTPSVSTEIWQRSGTAGDIDAIERVGVGTSKVSERLMPDALTPDPSPTADDPKTPLDEGAYDPDITLDVQGDISATKVQTFSICDATNQNCFAPADIGGNTGKLNCDGAVGGSTGNALTGISYTSPHCPAVPVIPDSGSCPSGQYLTGFSGGTPLCKSF